MKPRTGIWKKYTHEKTLEFMKSYAFYLKSECKKKNIKGYFDKIDKISQLKDPMKMREKLIKLTNKINNG